MNELEIRKEIEKHKDHIWIIEQGILLRKDKITIQEYNALTKGVYNNEKVSIHLGIDC